MESLAAGAHASTLERTYLQRLQAVQNIQQLRQTEQERSRLEIDKRICDFQTLQHFVPSGCYRWLKTEQRWNLVAVETAKALEIQFNEQCEQAAKLLTQSKESSTFPGEDDLSAECRRTVTRAKEIQQYRSGVEFELDDNP